MARKSEEISNVNPAGWTLAGKIMKGNLKKGWRGRKTITILLAVEFESKLILVRGRVSFSSFYLETYFKIFETYLHLSISTSPSDKKTSAIPSLHFFLYIFLCHVSTSHAIFLFLDLHIYFSCFYFTCYLFISSSTYFFFMFLPCILSF